MSRLLSFPVTLPVLFKAPAVGRRTKVLVVILAVAAGLAVGLVLFRAARAQRTQPTAASASSAGLRAAHARALDVAAHIFKTRRRVEERTRARTADTSLSGALFAMHSWYVAPPPPPPPPPTSVPTAASLAPPVPTAPPLPFQFIGSYQPDGGAQVFFLMQGDRVYDVRAGDTLENTYSVDGFNGSQLLLTYKPLNIKQQLSVGGIQ
jgi:hypothetical protein